MSDRIAAFEQASQVRPLLRSISRPNWIRLNRQRSTTDNVLSWLNADRLSAPQTIPELAGKPLPLLLLTYSGRNQTYSAYKVDALSEASGLESAVISDKELCIALEIIAIQCISGL